MKFEPCRVSGAYVVIPEPRADDRGHFARAWCEREFEKHGIEFRPRQGNVGFSLRRGTMRGIHFQTHPDVEAKLVRCVRGAVFDVVVDLRPGSPSYGEWYGTELTQDNGHMLFIPELCGHGCLSLEDESEIYYMASAFYSPGCAQGVRYDDPAFRVEWPIPVSIVSEQDRGWPDWSASNPTDEQTGGQLP